MVLFLYGRGLFEAPLEVDLLRSTADVEVPEVDAAGEDVEAAGEDVEAAGEDVEVAGAPDFFLTIFGFDWKTPSSSSSVSLAMVITALLLPSPLIFTDRAYFEGFSKALL